MIKDFRRWLKLLSNLGRRSMQTWHGRIILAGLTVGLFYLPLWLFHLIVRTIQGSAGLPLIAGCIGLGFWQLWAKQQELKELEASEADQVLGHLLIVGSVILFPFSRFALWPQAILWLFILAGIVISHWGLNFWWRYPLPTLLLAITVYPKPGIFARILWEGLTPQRYLDRFMAWSGAHGLQLIGLPAISDGTLVVLPPDGAVQVDWGCNGFSMAFTMATTGFVMGIFMKQRWPTVVMMTVIGAVLALIFNIPRIMLLAVASIHWGEESFNFWHGNGGGQIFSGILFTIYYYAIMAYIKRSPKRSRTQ